MKKITDNPASHKKKRVLENFLNHRLEFSVPKLIKEIYLTK